MQTSYLVSSELHKEILDTVAYSENFPFYTYHSATVRLTLENFLEKLSGLCRPTHDHTIVFEKNPPAYLGLAKPDWHFYYVPNFADTKGLSNYATSSH